ncbi:MAG: septum formation family protein [Acidimicrobiales bacterium]|nr:septum formation family protein [Acidimicrobiales bacterium]
MTPRPPGPIRRALLVALVAIGLLVGAGACTSDDDDAAPDGEDAQGEVLPTPTPGAEGEEAPTPVPEGVEVDRYSLNSGDCFNEYRQINEGLGLVDITTAVDCAREHDAEIYFTTIHPAPAGEPFPGSDEIGQWAIDTCYDAFADFVGVDYEVSLLEIGTVVPNLDNWTLGPYRGLHCFVFNPGGRLRGTMRGSQT